MTPISGAALWQKLAEAGIVEGDAPPPADGASPWYVRTMLGIAGWIGALFLLGFVGAAMAVVFDSAGAALVVGALCCTGASFIFRSRNDVALQFGLAISLAGQVMMIFGLGDILDAGGAVVPLLIAAFLPSASWVAVPVAVSMLGALGAIVAGVIDGSPVRWALVLSLGGVLMTVVGYQLQIA